MSDESPKPTVKRRAGRKRPLRVHWFARGLAFFIGLGLGTASVWAILRSGKDGAGTVALIISALLLWLIALVGHVPHRMWGKDIGYDMGDLDIPQEEADAIAEMPADLRDMVWSILSSMVLSAQEEGGQVARVNAVSGIARVSSSVRELAAFEEKCKRYLRQATSSIRSAGVAEVELDLDAASLRDRGVGDALIKSSYGTILFDFKVRLYESSARRELDAYAQWRRENPQASRLIILAESSTPNAQAVVDFTDELAPYVSVMIIQQGSGQPASLTTRITEVLMSMKHEPGEGAAGTM